MSMTRGSRFGTYEIGALIGVGGMGEVYRATDTTLKRDVALKVLPESFVTDANRLARLQREAEVLASLNHANVAQIYGFERSDGRSALVMELIDGVTLAERIGQGPLPPSEALDVALQIAAGLEAAHDRGIVHRDLKPANIKLTSSGSVKVLDFGIAKTFELRATSGPQARALTTPAMTEAGMVLGTAAYMAPEQARGKPVDKRADVWAFGCVLYEMLTGRAAFLGDDVTTTLARVLEGDPDLKALPNGLAPAVQYTLELCLQKDPKKRLRDVGDVRLALEGGLAVRAAVRIPLWRRVLPVAAALVVGATAVGVYVSTLAPPAAPAAAPVALPVTRFVITPPANAPLANLGGYDVTISPDGQRIAYFAEAEIGVATLQVRELDGLDARPLPASEVRGTGGGNMNPFFSPDGRSIGVYLPGRGVTRLALNGTPPLEIVDGPWSPAFLGATWGPDGTIVYSTGRSLHRVSASGGTPERLTPEAEGAFIASPVMLPGGRAVLYGFVEDGTERVTVFDFETQEPKALFEGQNATYVPTGHIVFARGTTLMAAAFDATELAVTGEAVAMLENVRHPNSVTAADYAISATGTLVYVPNDGDAGGRAAVVFVDRAGNVAGRAVSELVDNPRDPRLSPDGTRLFLTTGPIPESDLWSYDLSGRPPLPLAVAGNNRNGVVSPDGRRIILSVYVSDTEQLPELYTLPTDGSELAPQPLRADRLLGRARFWSAAGELFFVSVRDDGNPDIFATPAAASGEVREVVATEYAEFDPALSPNGRWLAYASERSGQVEIWVMGYPEGAPVRVSGNGGFEPRWSADGRELYYLQGSALMMVAVETERELSFAPPVQLFSGRYLADPAAASGSYDVAPDGRFVMIERSRNTGDSASIVVVQNWFEELKRRAPVN